MTSHQDKVRSKAPTKRYRDNHDAIFGPPTGNRGATAKERKRMADSRKATHAKLAEDGKKPADWYIQNERRVSSNPDYVAQRGPSDAYRANYAAIFKGGRK